MAKVHRFLGNIIIAVCWLFVFQALGWISFTEAGMVWWQALLVVAFITKLVEFIFDLVYTGFVLITCFLGCATLPVWMLAQGWLWLWGAAELTGWITINVNFIGLGVLMSVAYGLIRIPPVTSSSTSTQVVMKTE